MNNSQLTHIPININVQRVVWYIDQLLYGLSSPIKKKYKNEPVWHNQFISITI